MGVFSRFKKPEERVDGILLLHVYIGECAGKEMDVAGVAPDIGSCFAYSGLFSLASHIIEVLVGTVPPCRISSHPPDVSIQRQSALPGMGGNSCGLGQRQQRSPDRRLQCSQANAEKAFSSRQNSPRTPQVMSWNGRGDPRAYMDKQSGDCRSCN